MRKLFVSTSPHITSQNSTQKIMLDVILALMPAVIASVFIFGLYPLLVTLVSVTSCVVAEYFFNIITKRPNSTQDCSAIVTGMILAMNLPPVLPLYVPMVGGFFAIMVVKMLFGGLGRNFANPACTARIFLMLAWTGVMTKFVAPIDLSAGTSELFKYLSLGNNIDVVASATPLAFLKGGATGEFSLLSMFLGTIGGCAGEVSCLALLIGGVYLMARKVIDVKTPLLVIGSVALFTLIFTGNIKMVLPSVLSGGVMLGAFFMATDYASSPNTVWGKVIFAVGIGFITVLVRTFGSMNEGMSFAILFMNIVTPLLDKYIVPKPFGHQKKKKEKAVEVAK